MANLPNLATNCGGPGLAKIESVAGWPNRALDLSTSLTDQELAVDGVVRLDIVMACLFLHRFWTKTCSLLRGDSWPGGGHNRSGLALINQVFKDQNVRMSFCTVRDFNMERLFPGAGAFAQLILVILIAA
jgi:hypothetical protein